jgi:predicted homoserine dehydrogenase-like protein
VGWSEERINSVTITDDAPALIARPDVDVVVEATGSPAAGIAHARAAIRSAKHVIMVNVEADALAGPLLAREARAAGVVYSLAYGDQPALICELVDWARMCGFEVVAAGKGTKYLPAFHASTPETVWEHRAAMPPCTGRFISSDLRSTFRSSRPRGVANPRDVLAPSTRT